MNNQKYESNDISNDPELILQTIDNLQSEGFSRNAKKMLLTDKLLRTINRIKSPSISSIYNQGFEKDSRDTEITTAQQNSHLKPAKEIKSDRGTHTPFSLKSNQNIEDVNYSIQDRMKKMDNMYKKVSNKFLDNLYLHQLAVSNDEKSFNNEHFKRFIKKFRKDMDRKAEQNKTNRSSSIKLDLNF